MFRLALPCCLALAGLVLPVAAADPPLGLKDAQALQEALQKAIEDTEPAIACILVCRHEAFLKARETAIADYPGKLGDFDLDRERKKYGLKEAELEKLQKLDPGNADNVPEAYGSGVVVDESGLILTNYHVVRDATKIFVRLPGRKSSYADIHAADPRSDLAVLRLLKPPSGLKALKLGDGGKVRKGQLVLSIANPFAAGFRDGNPSASWGIISNLRRRAPLPPADPSLPQSEHERKRTLHHYGTLIQTDNRLNLGCSGGALVDLKGELIGLTTALAALGGTETPGGFAVPMDTPMKRIVEVLKRGEEVEYGFLGVTLPRTQAGKGVMIESVTPWSPAHRAGLRANDTILSVDGTPVHENDDLFLAVGTVLANSEAKIEAKSLSGQVRTVTVTMAKFYVPGPIIASKKPAAVRGLRVDYVSVLLLTTKGGINSPALPPGVMVREVQADSAAALAKLKVNDVITHVNGKSVTTPAEFYREAQKVSGPLELTLDPSRTVKIN